MGLFVAAGLAAGLFNYLYQILASRELALLDFSAFNAWFANLAILFTLPALLQYAAVFSPLPERHAKSTLIGANLFLLGLASTWFWLPAGLTWPRAIWILCAACVFGWLSGQAQIRLLMRTLATAGLLVGLIKVALVLGHAGEGIDNYTSALFLAFVPATWLLSMSLWRAPVAPRAEHANAHRLIAPFLLSLTSSTLPQMDLVLLHITQTAEQFAPFALASLFYKAIYFIVAAYLAWLLPHQVRGQAPGFKARAVLAFVLGGVMLSAVIATVGPKIAGQLLHWSAEPPRLWVFLACLNTGLLTWIFVALQEACARGHLRLAGLVCLGFGVEAGLQLALGLSVPGYLILALAGQIALAVSLKRVQQTAEE